MEILNAWALEPYNPYDRNIWYITDTEDEIDTLLESDPFTEGYTKKR